MDKKKHLGKYATAANVQSDIDNGKLGKPYVAWIEDGGSIDYNSKIFFPLTGSGTEDDPVLGWYENVALIINPDGLANGTLSGSLPGIFNFAVETFSGLEDYVFFSYNGTVNRVQNMRIEGDGYYCLMPRVERVPVILNTETSQMGYIYIYPNDTITFRLIED